MVDSPDPKLIKDIKIKTGVVKRLHKEKVSYENETLKLQEKINEIRSTNPEEYSLKKQEELLNESKKMISDCDKRLVVAWDELSKIMPWGPKMEIKYNQNLDFLPTSEAPPPNRSNQIIIEEMNKDHLTETEEYKAAMLVLEESRASANRI